MFTTLALLWIVAASLVVLLVFRDLIAAGMSVRRAWVYIIGISFCVIIAAFHGPRAAGNLPISDSVEYAVSAFRVVESGTPDPYRALLPIEGQELPSRYAPWFPTFVLAPSMAVASYFLPSSTGLVNAEAIGWGVVPITVSAVLIVLLQLGIMARVAGVSAGLVGVLITICLPGFFFYSEQILIDIPFTLCALLSLRISMSIHQRTGNLWLWLGFGAICAAAAALRVTGLILLLPGVVLLYLKIRDRTLSVSAILTRCLLLGAPIIVVLGVTARYNQEVFGTALRNGYNLWVAVPYDYLGLTFSPSYLPQNLIQVLSDGTLLIGLTLAAFAILRRCEFSRSARLLGAFWLLSGLPLLLTYLFYFWFDQRFYLTIQVLLVSSLTLGIMALVGKCFNGSGCNANVWLVSLILLISAANYLNAPLDKRRHLIDDLVDNAPAGSIIITGIDPVMLYPWLGRGADAKRILPISRRVEFASKVLTWKRVSPLIPEAAGPLDHRAPGLFRGGAVEAAQEVALEMSVGEIAELAELYAQRDGLIVDWESLDPSEIERLREVLGAGVLPMGE